MSATLSARLAVCNGRPSGFDYLRIGLAVMIFLIHAMSTSYGPEVYFWIRNSLFRPVIALWVPMFFALSGFLVSGALERSKTMISFLGMRILRVYPALIAEVTLSAFILGPLLTELPLHSYFSNPIFHKYLYNITGNIHYYLPGVFLHIPGGARVNSQLWTVPFELECYAVISALAVFGVARRQSLLVGVVAISQLGWAVYTYLHPVVASVASMTVNPRGIVFCFLWGVILFSYRERIIWSRWLGLLSFIVSWVLIALPRVDAFAALPVAYLTVYVGLMNPVRARFLEKGDYSYGIYLFGIPIQQAVASMGTWAQSIWVSLLIAGPLTVLFAAASWNLLEKRVLAERPRLLKLESLYLRYRHRIGQRFVSAKGVETATRPLEMMRSSGNQS